MSGPTLGDPLDSAISAADGGCQAAWGIWQLMTATERDEWLALRRDRWPRRDALLTVILPAAEALIAAERGVVDDEPPQPD